MFVTTTLLAIQCYYVKRLHWIIALVLFLFFGFFDGTYKYLMGR
jgi:KUP system potassium uptake protein